MMMGQNTLLCVALLLLCAQVQALTVFSIDLGGKWLKIGMVKPGVPGEIVLNAETQRKTSNAIALFPDERYFGGTALTKGVRNPEYLIEDYVCLLGKKFDDLIVAEHQKKYPHIKLVATPVYHTVSFDLGYEGGVYTVEEITAMMLEHALMLGSSFAEEKANSATIVVPAYFNQVERKAFLRAADLAGLSVLQLINDNAAVSINYGMFNQDKISEKEKQNLLIYDMGATYTVATVVKLSFGFKKGMVGVKTPLAEIKGMGYDPSLGGNAFDFELRDHLVKEFESQAKNKGINIRVPRALNKLLTAANKAKHVLSANTDTVVQVEGVLVDVDFKAPVSRDTFESLCEKAGLYDRVEKPFMDALESAGLKKDDISAFIVVGGGQRMPKIQDILVKLNGGKPLNRNINADEAATMGAVFAAASISKAFVPRYELKDAIFYPVDAKFIKEDGTEVVKPLFKYLGKLPDKKTMTFTKTQEDFSIQVINGEKHGGNMLFDVNIKGLAGVMEKHKDVAIPVATKVIFQYDTNGIASVAKVETLFNRTDKEEGTKDDDAATGKEDESGGLWDYLSKKVNDYAEGEENNAEDKTEGEESTEKTDEDKTVEAEDATGDSAADANEDAADGDGKGKKAGEKAKPKKEKKKIDTSKVQRKHKLPKEFKVSVDFEEVLPYSVPSVDAQHVSMEKLKVIQRREAEKALVQAKRNELESTIYGGYDNFENEKYIKLSNEPELESLKEAFQAASAWLEDAYEADSAAFITKINELNNLTAGVYGRYRESQELPDAVAEFKKIVTAGYKLQEVPADQKYFTDEVLNKTLDEIKAAEEWLEAELVKQKTVPGDQDPVLKVKDVRLKTRALARNIQIVYKTPPPPKPKPEKKKESKKNTTSNETDDVGSEEFDTESAETDTGSGAGPDIGTKDSEEGENSDEKVDEKEEL